MDKDKKKFILWEQKVFGYGYGSGEEYVLKALKDFLEICPFEGNYDYEILEKELTPAVAWLLINILCRSDILEYGTSPRFGWLTQEGKELKIFTGKYKVETLTEMTNISEDENWELHSDEENQEAED